MPTRRLTPQRTIAIPDNEWNALKELAAKTGRSVSDLVRPMIQDLLVANKMIKRTQVRDVINPVMPRQSKL
jgi:predicted CopG family antitoxin